MRNRFLTVLAAFLLFTMIGAGDVKAKDKKGEGESGVQFIELNPLILPIINEHGRTQVISLVVAIEVDSQEKADMVTKFQPRLADAFLSDLYGSFAQKMPVSGIIPISYLKERLNFMSEKVLGEEVVRDVLVQVMQKRPA